MARISTMMDIGRRSMSNSQTGLQTVGHNIANANTEGYSRQRVELQSAEPVTMGRHRQGMGAKTAQVTRTVNTYLDKQIQNETGKLGTATGREENLGRVEEVFNEATNKGLNRFMANFFNSFRELANTPESQATRALVKESAKYMTDDFRRITGALKDIQKDIDNQVNTEVTEINGLSKEIASLNQSVAHIEVQGMPANDERDRRDLLLKKLSEKINIRWGESDNGMVSVTAGNTAVLVAGSSHQELGVAKTPENETKREGNLDVWFQNSEGGTKLMVTNQITGGKLGGALDVRDKVINEILDNMDSMAYQLHENVNMVHSVGYDRYGNTGLNFFEGLTNVRDAAEKLNVSGIIQGDPGRIVAGIEPNSPADNRIANTLAGLQNRTLLKDGTSTFDDYFNGLVGEFAVTKRHANMAQDHQQNIVKQLTTIRDSVSGVSLDEETTKMIEFQKSFDASARLIRTADEMFDTILSLKRM